MSALFKKVAWLPAMKLNCAAVAEGFCVRFAASETTTYFELPEVTVAESNITKKPVYDVPGI